VKVTMLLADAAQEVGGKLYVLGGGWSLKGPDPAPMALALKIAVPWNEANRRHPIRLLLLGEDGHPPELLGEAGEVTSAPVEFTGQLEVGRPVGLPEGTDIDAALAIGVGPLPLAPGHGYVWRLEIDGESQETWQLPFRVLAHG
jgi:hypothetical protein